MTGGERSIVLKLQYNNSHFDISPLFLRELGVRVSNLTGCEKVAMPFVNILGDELRQRIVEIIFFNSKGSYTRNDVFNLLTNFLEEIGEGNNISINSLDFFRPVRPKQSSIS